MSDTAASEQHNAAGISAGLFRTEVQPDAVAAGAGELVADDPVRIEPAEPSDGVPAGFWRTCVRSGATRKVVGYFDFRVENGAGRITRRTPIDRESVGSQQGQDVLDLGTDAVQALVRNSLGNDVQFIGAPRLVFDGADTRVAWHVRVRASGEEFGVFVTPGFVYRARPRAGAGAIE